MTSHLQEVSFNESTEHFHQENMIYDDRLLFSRTNPNNFPLTFTVGLGMLHSYLRLHSHDDSPVSFALLKRFHHMTALNRFLDTTFESNSLKVILLSSNTKKVGWYSCLQLIPAPSPAIPMSGHNTKCNHVSNFTIDRELYKLTYPYKSKTNHFD